MKCKLCLYVKCIIELSNLENLGYYELHTCGYPVVLYINVIQYDNYHHISSNQKYYAINQNIGHTGVRSFSTTQKIF